MDVRDRMVARVILSPGVPRVTALYGTTGSAIAGTGAVQTSALPTESLPSPACRENRIHVTESLFSSIQACVYRRQQSRSSWQFYHRTEQWNCPALTLTSYLGGN